MRDKRYKFHEWLAPSTDPGVGYLFPSMGLPRSIDDGRAVCGLNMGGCANGSYKYPHCEECLAKITKAEDNAYLALCKAHRRAITSILLSVKKLAGKVDNISPLLLGDAFDDDQY